MSKKVVLACTKCHSRNYTTMKTDNQQNDRLQVRKYCKTCGTHTTHMETK
ncbi:50S ribosomal protein L33 [Bacillus shivajii]|nr:50S ribosomal protein L33 [Bacillus shivajii]UCZ53354.1 50S ribosomal protein L33 [Bacillus shivajii]